MNPLIPDLDAKAKVFQIRSRSPSYRRIVESVLVGDAARHGNDAAAASINNAHQQKDLIIKIES